MKVVLLHVPLPADKKYLWESFILKTNLGLSFTQKQKGFISAEYGYATDIRGNLSWNCWEKWETKEDFDNYHAKREESGFMEVVWDIIDSDTAPGPLWIEDLETMTAEKEQ